MIVITHDPDDVRAFGEHVLRMDGGAIAHLADVADLELAARGEA